MTLSFEVWFHIFKTKVSEHGVRGAAKILQVSPALVSQNINGKYPMPSPKLQNKVIALWGQVSCKVYPEVGNLLSCSEKHKEAYLHNPLAVQRYQMCLKCEFNPRRQDDQ